MIESEAAKFEKRQGSFQRKLRHRMPQLISALDMVLDLRNEKAWNAGQAPKDLLVSQLEVVRKTISDAIADIRAEDEEEEL